MTYVAITIAGTDVEVIDIIRQLNRVHHPPQVSSIPPVVAKPKPVVTVAPEPAEPVAPAPPVLDGWDVAGARRLVSLAAGNAKQLLDAMLEQPDCRIAEDEAMAMLGTHRRGIGAVKRSLDSVRRKVRPDAPYVLYTTDDGMLVLDRSFVDAVVDIA